MRIREEEIQKNELLQWHPAFSADIQIELSEDAENLAFESEHFLSNKPMSIDVLIIKKLDNKVVHKNIGRIFRKYNIVEYKSPKDYLSIDDFYKVYGYTCFYKSDYPRVNGILLTELTVSFFCHKYPRKLIRHLEKERGYEIKKIENGIYYVIGDIIPIQIVVTKQLSEKENLWLKSLTDDLRDNQMTTELVENYQRNRKNPLYKAVMNIIIRANRNQFEEARTMCEALRELFADEWQEREEKWQKREEKWKEEEEQWQKREGQALIQGNQQVNALTLKLAELGRMDDIIKAASDAEYQKKLFEEFGL